MRNELPEFYFFVLPDTGQLVTIRRNEHGYYHSDWSTDDKVRNQEIADFQNQKLGITPAQQQAMECGSMFGWKSPGALRLREVHDLLGLPPFRRADTPPRPPGPRLLRPPFHALGHNFRGAAIYT